MKLYNVNGLGLYEGTHCLVMDSSKVKAIKQVQEEYDLLDGDLDANIISLGGDVKGFILLGYDEDDSNLELFGKLKGE